MEEYSKLNDNIYWRDEAGIYVNLFVPSELNWNDRGFRLRQETKFPEEQATRFSVTVDRPVQVAVRLRIPSWLQSGPMVKLNGKALEATAAPGSYLTLARTWNSGDRIEIELPMHLAVEAMPDDRTMQALLFGPLVLAGDLGSDGLTEELMVGPRVNGPPLRGAPALTIPTFRAASTDPSTWIKPADRPLAFRTTGQSAEVNLVPLNSLFGRRYSIYWQVS